MDDFRPIFFHFPPVAAFDNHFDDVIVSFEDFFHSGHLPIMTFRTLVDKNDEVANSHIVSRRLPFRSRVEEIQILGRPDFPERGYAVLSAFPACLCARLVSVVRHDDC